MYPFKNSFLWHVKGRTHHLIEATEQAMGEFKPARQKRLKRRISFMKRALFVQLVVLVLLYIGVAATAASLLGRAFAELEGAADALGAVAAATAPASGALFLVLLLVRRTLGQLDADLIMLVSLRGT